MIKRRAVLYAWFAKEHPFGRGWGLNTFDAWIDALKYRVRGYNVNVIWRDPELPLSRWGVAYDACVKLRRFLTAEALTAPKFDEVKSAMAEIESYVPGGALNMDDLQNLQSIRRAAPGRGLK